MKGTKGHRERKNGASREQWMESKAATNAACVRRRRIVWLSVTLDASIPAKHVRVRG